MILLGYIMKNYTVEELDKSRYNMILWSTIGWGIWFGSFILKNEIDNYLLKGFLLLLGLISSVIWVKQLLKLRKLLKIMKSDNALSNALNDEVVAHNRLKSFQVSHISFVLVTVIFVIISTFTSISALLVSEVILFFGVLSGMIAWLVYNKN